MFDFNKLFRKKEPEANKEESKADEVKKEEPVPLNLSVHVMPKRFLDAASHAKNSKNAGLIILASGIFLLIALGAGGYYYFYIMKPGSPVEPRPEPVVTEENPAAEATTGAAEQEEEAAQIKDAKNTYAAFRNKITSLGSAADYDALVKSQAEGQFLADWSGVKDKALALSQSDQDSFIEYIKTCQPKISEIENLLGGVRDANGKITLTVTSSSFAVSADLMKANGEWKIVSEQGYKCLDESGVPAALAEWIDKKASGVLPESGEQLVPAKDSDADGLTDTEETLIGTDSEKGDSDADDYSDLSELKNLYNPAGTGKLADNPNIKAYANQNFSYNLYYPAKWNIEKVTGGDTIIFRSPDNQFLQVLVQPNANKEEIEAWYNSQFENATTTPAVMEKADADGKTLWRAVKSPDNLTLYLTNLAKEYIYVLSYSPGEGKILEYPNIYQTMIDSFQIGT
ncbi:MAG: hypothetical protein WC715_01020 [Patescibacteria group bacterium]|jgi:hypothetical protein